jgi:predicted membrane-bound spermidine synthase
MTRRPSSIYLFSFLLAFSSLFFELVYAQVLSVCLGGTKTQYFTIISLFTCALGFGTIAQGRLRRRFPVRQTFFRIEVLLTVIGSLGPFVITWLLQPRPSALLSILGIGLSYGLVVVIGFLSGFETPSLFALLPDTQGKVLAYDYLGMLVASVSFPLFFLPELGTAASTLTVAGANLLSLVWLRTDHPVKWKSFMLYGSCLVWIALIVSKRSELNDFLSSLYLGSL